MISIGENFFKNMFDVKTFQLIKWKKVGKIFATIVLYFLSFLFFFFFYKILCKSTSYKFPSSPLFKSYIFKIFLYLRSSTTRHSFSKNVEFKLVLKSYSSRMISSIREKERSQTI